MLYPTSCFSSNLICYRHNKHEKNNQQDKLDPICLLHKYITLRGWCLYCIRAVICYVEGPPQRTNYNPSLVAQQRLMCTHVKEDTLNTQQLLLVLYCQFFFHIYIPFEFIYDIGMQVYTLVFCAVHH